jgi:hypothetical protein
VMAAFQDKTWRPRLMWKKNMEICERNDGWNPWSGKSKSD